MTRFGSIASPRAFTLLEMVAGLAMVAILAALLLPVWGAGIRENVAAARQLNAAHELRSEMENWIHLAATVYREQFDNLPALIADYYQAESSIDVIESFWIRFDPGPAQSIVESPATETPADHLRVTLRHSVGHELTFLFTRQPS